MALPSPKFQLQPLMVPPVSVEVSVNAHDSNVQFVVNAATGVLGGGGPVGLTVWLTVLVAARSSVTVNVTV